METFKASSQGFDAFVSLSKGEDIQKDQFLEKIDGMYPKMAKHVKSQWKRLGGKWAVCQAVITRDERDMIKDVLGSNVGKNLINADLFNSNFTNEDFQNIPIPHL